MKRIFLTLLALTTLSSVAAITESDKAVVRGGAVNLLKNPGAEAGKGDFTQSGGTWAVVSSGSNLLFGAASFTFDASSSGQYIQTSVYTVPEGLKGNKCLGRVWYLGGDATNKLQVVDGDGDLLVERTFTGDTGKPEPLSVNFTCPDASGNDGKLRLKVISTQNASIVALDAFHLGEADNFSQQSQASIYGGVVYPATASCLWITTSNSYANYSADSDCTTPTGTNVIGQASAPATKVPGVTFSKMAPGRYRVVATGGFLKNGVAGQTCFFRFSDGTNTTSAQLVYGNSTSEITVPVLEGYFDYTAAQSAVTIQIQAKNDGSSVPCDVAAQANDLNIQVYRFPFSSQDALLADTASWYGEATIGGANPSLGTAAVSSYTEIVDSSMTLTQSSRSTVSLGVACSTTNAATVGSTTCSSGSEGLGVTLNVPAPGLIEVCADFTHYMTTGTTSEVETFFQVVETSASSQTILQEGGPKQGGRHRSDGGTIVTGRPQHACGMFSVTSAGQKTFRLMYEQNIVAGTLSTSAILADENSSAGQRNVRFTVRPVNQNVPAPVLYGPFKTTTTQSSAYTALQSDELIILNTASGSFTLGLPSAVGIAGKVYEIRTSSNSNIATIDPNSTETVCGQSTIVVSGANDYIRIYSDGTNWQGLDKSCLRSEWATLNCDSGSSITSQNNNWFSAVGNVASGICTGTMLTGIFSAAPRCVMTRVSQSDVVTAFAQVNVSSATAMAFVGTAFTIGSGFALSSAYDVYVNCTGPR